MLIAFTSANAFGSARAASMRFWASSFFWKSSSLPEMLASHQAMPEAISSGRSLASWAATNLRARSVDGASAVAMIGRQRTKAVMPIHFTGQTSLMPPFQFRMRISPISSGQNAVGLS